MLTKLGGGGGGQNRNDPIFQLLQTDGWVKLSSAFPRWVKVFGWTIQIEAVFQNNPGSFSFVTFYKFVNCSW